MKGCRIGVELVHYKTGKGHVDRFIKFALMMYVVLIVVQRDKNRYSCECVYVSLRSIPVSPFQLIPTQITLIHSINKPGIFPTYLQPCYAKPDSAPPLSFTV